MMRNEKELNESVINMDFVERVTLSPFQKYFRFSRFPYKFILHILLIVLCTYQSLKIVSVQDKHTRIQEEVFSTIYLQNSDGSSTYPYYSLTAFTDNFFKVINNTLGLDQTLLQYSEVNTAQFSLQIYYDEVRNEQFEQGSVIITGDLHTFIPELKRVALAPGDYAAMKTFLQKVEKMNLNINNVQTYVSMDQQGNRNSCLNWTIGIVYSFQSFANVEASLEAEPNQCNRHSSAENNSSVSMRTPSLVAIHLAVMLCSALSLVLSWRTVYFVSKEYLHYKRAGERESSPALSESRFKSHGGWDKSWEELGFFDKLKFFDFWFVVIIAGNFFQFFGAFVSLLDHYTDITLAIFAHKEVLVGFGVMLAWVTVLKYLEYSSELNLMTATLAKSWGNLFVFLIGVMPFFLGFVFLGQTIFWKYNKFQDTSSSVITLFSLLNGDIVNDTFLETWAEGIAGQIYLIVFMILFYTAVQNVFVTIIMEGYQESIKEKEYKKEIEEKERVDRQGFEKCLKAVDSVENEHEGLQQIPDDHNIDPNQEINHSSDSSPEQRAAMTQMVKNGKKVDLILDELGKLRQEIASSALSTGEKMYLERLLKENLQTIGRNIKIKIEQIDR